MSYLVEAVLTSISKIICKHIGGASSPINAWELINGERINVTTIWDDVDCLLDEFFFDKVGENVLPTIREMKKQLEEVWSMFLVQCRMVYKMKQEEESDVDGEDAVMVLLEHLYDQ